MELQDKKYRILDIFFRLLKGEFVSMRQLADEYSVSGKKVSRDINEIRAYLSENEYRNGNAQIEYSHREKAYYLSMDDFLSSKELLVLIEILISSRALPKNSMEEIWLQCTKSFIHLWWNKRGWVTLGHTSIHFLSFPKHAYHPFYGINSFDFLRRHISF